MIALSSIRRRFLQNAIDVDRPLRSLVRWPAWIVACATGRPTIAQFATAQLKISLAPHLFGFGSTSIYIKRDAYEPELLAIGRIIEPGSVVLDIGGSFGVFSLFMAHFAGPSGKVHTFEPGQFSFSQLDANVVLNGFDDRVVRHHVAASDHADTLMLMHIAGSPVNFSIGAGDGEYEKVDAVRVETLVPDDEKARVGFIKIDVEGYEQAALEGARSILTLSHPTIMFEVSANALERQGATPADMYEYLRSYGYRFWTFEDGKFEPVLGTPEGNIFASIIDLTER